MDAWATDWKRLRGALQDASDLIEATLATTDCDRLVAERDAARADVARLWEAGDALVAAMERKEAMAARVLDYVAQSSTCDWNSEQAEALEADVARTNAAVGSAITDYRAARASLAATAHADEEAGG